MIDPIPNERKYLTKYGLKLGLKSAGMADANYEVRILPPGLQKVMTYAATVYVQTEEAVIRINRRGFTAVVDPAKAASGIVSR